MYVNIPRGSPVGGGYARAASRFAGREPEIPRLRVPGENAPRPWPPEDVLSDIQEDQPGERGRRDIDTPLPRESLPRESLPRESVPRESVPRESLPRGSVPRDPLPRESMPRDQLSANGSQMGQSQSSRHETPIHDLRHGGVANGRDQEDINMDYRSDFSNPNANFQDDFDPDQVQTPVQVQNQGRKRRSVHPPTPDRFYQRRRPIQEDVPYGQYLPRVPPHPALHAPGFVPGPGFVPYPAQPPFMNQLVGRNQVNQGDPGMPRAIPQNSQAVPQIVYKSSGKLRVPFPKVTQSRRPTSDPAGLLTGVSHEVIEVLRNGWNEVIPLGHFARRYSPLISNHVPSSSGEGLSEIPLMDMTINDWNEIKRNMPRALREHLIPENKVVPGTEEALAAADMIETFFGIVDGQSRLTDEVVPLMIYADQKITFWRFRPERMERMDVFDNDIYRNIFEEWKKKVRLFTSPGHRPVLAGLTRGITCRIFFVISNQVTAHNLKPLNLTLNPTGLYTWFRILDI
ncbi:hypothetical protein EV361DRAFT_869336 [Lentinula raphanica]|nr:hypothetical protein EV361DRAFT_869336 [Lentinula raphanica]